MVNRSRTARRGRQAAFALRPWCALDQRSGLPPRSVAGCPVDGPCGRLSGRDRGRRARCEKARRGVDQSPVDWRGSEAPTGATVHRPRRRPSSRADARITCRLATVPRRSQAALVNTPGRRAFVQPRAGPITGRLTRTDRPGSSCIGAQTGLRAAIDPPALPESAARFCGPLSPAQTRSGGAQPPVGRPSALGQVRFGPQPGPGRSTSPPLRATGSRSSCPAAACADPSGTPGTPTPAPRSVPGGGRDARAHISPRVRRGDFQKEKSERGAGRPVQAWRRKSGVRRRCPPSVPAHGRGVWRTPTRDRRQRRTPVGRPPTTRPWVPSACCFGSHASACRSRTSACLAGAWNPLHPLGESGHVCVFDCQTLGNLRCRA